jgi:quinol monooxygenase YgiN
MRQATVLYRWKLKKGAEERFVSAWTAITEHYLANFGSLGSRLHSGSDGVWYAYAQWPSEEARQNAFLGSDLEDAAAQMAECIEERFPEVFLDVAVDRLKG